jgi:NAD(P)-dependent dehydrogenase (short-subunit alcohol dehydrogenase family)
MVEVTQEHIFIVGGSSGIGKNLAISLSRDNNVSVIARREAELKHIEEKYEIFTQQADVSNDEELANSINSSVDRYGKINKFIYCAGAQIIKPHRLMKIEEFDHMYDVNLRGAMICSKLFCSAKISEKNAVFCAVSSIAGVKPEPGIVAYSSMKAALDHMIRGLAMEYGPRRFVGVAPGWLETEMTQNQPLYNDAFKNDLKEKSPLGLTEINDVVNSIKYLISDKASSITGQILCVDSGSSL